VQKRNAAEDAAGAPEWENALGVMAENPFYRGIRDRKAGNRPAGQVGHGRKFAGRRRARVDCVIVPQGVEIISAAKGGDFHSIISSLQLLLEISVWNVVDKEGAEGCSKKRNVMLRQRSTEAGRSRRRLGMIFGFS
jgi:hypothetical protein